MQAYQDSLFDRVGAFRANQSLLTQAKREARARSISLSELMRCALRNELERAA